MKDGGMTLENETIIREKLHGQKELNFKSGEQRIREIDWEFRLEKMLLIP